MRHPIRSDVAHTQNVLKVWDFSQEETKARKAGKERRRKSQEWREERCGRLRKTGKRKHTLNILDFLKNWIVLPPHFWIFHNDSVLNLLERPGVSKHSKHFKKQDWKLCFWNLGGGAHFKNRKFETQFQIFWTFRGGPTVSTISNIHKFQNTGGGRGAMRAGKRRTEKSQRRSESSERI